MKCLLTSVWHVYLVDRWHDPLLSIKQCVNVEQILKEKKKDFKKNPASCCSLIKASIEHRLKMYSSLRSSHRLQLSGVMCQLLEVIMHVWLKHLKPWNQLRKVEKKTISKTWWTVTNSSWSCERFYLVSHCSKTQCRQTYKPFRGTGNMV